MKFLALNVHQLHNCARFLYSRRAAPDDDEGQHPPAHFFIVLILFRTLEHMQHMVAYVQCFLQGFHAIGMFFNAFHAKEIRRRPRGKHQIIIRYFAVVRQNDLSLLIHPFDICHKELDIFIVTEGRANWIGNLIGREHRRRNLVEQRLKQCEVMTVDKCYTDIFLSKQFGKFHSAKPCTDDDNVFLLHDASSLYENFVI